VCDVCPRHSGRGDHSPGTEWADNFTAYVPGIVPKRPPRARVMRWGRVSAALALAAIFGALCAWLAS
jgi:hypothetical protein